MQSEHSRTLRILLLADTHLGFDLPFRPRVARRRRGHDFFHNYERALAPALKGEVDLVIHGGDLLYRSKVPAALVDMALEPLVRVAEKGTPVYLVPGNHERSRIPLQLWGRHPGLHIFDRPQTFLHGLDGWRIGLSGFPFTRSIRDRFTDIVESTAHRSVKADLKLLCLHQTVEGARVGPVDFTFRGGDDVICGADLSTDFSAVLAGHIHRAQVLCHDLRGQPLAAPVIYPGSIERTSFAERDEEKSYTLVEIRRFPEAGAQRVKARVVRLPARPMISLTLEPPGEEKVVLDTWLQAELGKLDPDAVVRIRFAGTQADRALERFTASRMRELAPPTMNVSTSGGWREASANPERD